MKTREEIEEELIECLENIKQYRYTSRWLRRIVHFVWINVVIGGSLLILNDSFALPYVSNLLNVIAAILLIIAAITFFASIFIFSSEILGGIGEGFNAWIALAEAKYKHKSLRHLLADMPAPLSPNTYPNYYLQEIPQDIFIKRVQADRYQRLFMITQSIVIILSTTVASISGGWLDRYFILPWLIPVLSGIISLITGFSLLLKFREKGNNLRQTADALDLEYKSYLLGHGVYKEMKDPEARRIHFTEKAEVLRKEQLQRQQQLEQSSQHEHALSKAPSS